MMLVGSLHDHGGLAAQTVCSICRSSGGAQPGPRPDRSFRQPWRLLLPVVRLGLSSRSARSRAGAWRRTSRRPRGRGRDAGVLAGTPISVSSLAPRQTCHPSAQRSSTVQSMPVALLPSFRRRARSREPATARSASREPTSPCAARDRREARRIGESLTRAVRASRSLSAACRMRRLRRRARPNRAVAPLPAAASSVPELPPTCRAAPVVPPAAAPLDRCCRRGGGARTVCRRRRPRPNRRCRPARRRPRPPTLAELPPEPTITVVVPPRPEAAAIDRAIERDDERDRDRRRRKEPTRDETSPISGCILPDRQDLNYPPFDPRATSD
jgi:hypothetical protein